MTWTLQNDGGTEGNSDEEIEGMMMDCYGLNQDMDVEQVEASDGDGDDDDDEDAEDHSVLKNKTNFRYFEVSLTSKFVSWFSNALHEHLANTQMNREAMEENAIIDREAGAWFCGKSTWLNALSHDKNCPNIYI